MLQGQGLVMRSSISKQLPVGGADTRKRYLTVNKTDQSRGSTGIRLHMYTMHVLNQHFLPLVCTVLPDFGFWSQAASV